jgi:uncharacterized protein (DUF58 family)
MHEAIARSLMEGQQAGMRYCLASPRRSSRGEAGIQMGKQAGESMEFMDHREYQPGDDLRRLDWAAYARSDRMIVNVYRQEVSPHIDIVIDGSRSMALGGTQKLRAAAAVAAVLAAAANNAGHTHRAFLTGQGCRPVVHGSEQPRLWQGMAFDSRESPPVSFRTLPPAWRPRGIRAVISDLLWLGDPLEMLTNLSDRAAAVYILQVLAADDVAPPHRGNVRLADSETDAVEEVFLEAADVARYRRHLQQHRENWHHAARQVGALLVPLIAEDLCKNWDFSPLMEAGILTL